MKQDLVLVVGGTGLIGSELIKQLKAQGYRTRSTTSKAINPSEELVQVNLSTGEGIKAAFEGVDRAFLLSPPGYADQYAMLAPLIQESKRRGLKKVVLMTAMGANANEAAPFRKAELDLEKSGLSYNIIRPNWFLQNFNSFWVHGINQQGKILLPAGTAKVSFIDARDISAVAAKLLANSELDGKDFDLTGSEAVDHAQVAQAIAKVAGRKVEYQEISPVDFKNALVGAGFPEGYVDFLVLIFGFLKEGYSAGITTNVEQITGKAPRTLDQYVNDFKNSWIK
jgi:uncharacterized protein YbjT (DUF2867 family)